MQRVPFLRSVLGLNTKVDPVRLPYDPESGAQFLSEAVNVDIDATGRVSRRKGIQKMTNRPQPHSLWSNFDGTSCFFISENKLHRLRSDGMIMDVKVPVEVGAKAHYCEIGNDIFFSNGHEQGIIRDGFTWEDWVQTDYTGPDTTRSFNGPPIGGCMGYHAGRIFVAVDNHLFYSEPFNYGCFDYSSGFVTLSGSEINNISTMDFGLFVSTDDAVYWLRGPGPDEWDLRRVLVSPVIPGTVVSIQSELISEEYSGRAIVFATRDHGLCMFIGDGRIVFLSQDLVDLPVASAGHAVFNKDNNFQYLTFLEV